MATGLTEQPPGIKASSFAVRVLTAGLYAAAMLAALWLGTLATGITLGVLAGLAAAEFYAMERREARLPNELIGVVAAGAMPLAAALWGQSGLSSIVTALVVAALVWHVVFNRVRTADTAVTLFGAVYVGFTLGHLVLLRSHPDGLYLSLVLVVSVWANDSFAYLAGSLFGKHKMAPRISPKKSWEGFFAGVVGTLAVWIAARALPGIELPLRWAMAAGVGVAIATVVGDLAESRMKREAGVKDSGNALPGHGGFLDRLDSLILASIVAYWILWWGGVR